MPPSNRPDRHNEIELNLLKRGWLTYLIDGHRVRIEPGRLTVFWAAIPHPVVEWEVETEYYLATASLAWILNCRLPEKSVQSLLDGKIVAEAGSDRAHSDLQLFADWEQDAACCGAGAGKETLLELEARLIRLARNPSACMQGEANGFPNSAGLGSKAEQMAQLIAQHYTEHISVHTIAASVGLHPNYAMSLFQRAFGTTLVGCLTEHRVAHAQRMLVTTDEKIIRVASTSGFGSLSSFNEAFRGMVGCSPREYRQTHHMD